MVQNAKSDIVVVIKYVLKHPYNHTYTPTLVVSLHICADQCSKSREHKNKVRTHTHMYVQNMDMHKVNCVWERKESHIDK